MSLSLSFHTNFVQMEHRGSTYWAARSAWEDLAQDLLKESAPEEPLILSLTDLEVEVSRSMTPALTLVFPDGLEEWLTLQASSFPRDQREGLYTLMAASQCVPRSKWSAQPGESALYFLSTAESESAKTRQDLPEGVELVALTQDSDEVLEWTSAITQAFLREKLKKETSRFLEKNKSRSVQTLTAQGRRAGLHSPLLGLSTALSNFLESVRPTQDNYLYLGWENFLFAYRDSLGNWHSHLLHLQPFHSFKVDPQLKILPEPYGKLFLPMGLSLSPRPTLLDVFQQFVPLPQPASPLSAQRLKDSFTTFFNMKWTSTSPALLLESIREEIFWSVESLRTSEKCLVEGPLAPLLTKKSLAPGFDLGSDQLLEVHFAGGKRP